MEQKHIKVEAMYCPDYKFRVRPTAFYLEVDGVTRRIPIDRITGEVKAASLKLGKAGIRYTCRVREKYLYLYKDVDEWHLEMPSP